MILDQNLVPKKKHFAILSYNIQKKHSFVGSWSIFADSCSTNLICNKVSHVKFDDLIFWAFFMKHGTKIRVYHQIPSPFRPFCQKSKLCGYSNRFRNPYKKKKIKMQNCIQEFLLEKKLVIFVTIVTPSPSQTTSVPSLSAASPPSSATDS